MSASVFAEFKFWLLVVFSIILPSGIYAMLLVRRAVSRSSALMFGFGLVAIAGVDVYLLQNLASAARLTPSLADDSVFISEVRIALYLLPAMFGGIGINIVSNVLVKHLDDAEAEFRKEHPPGDS